MLEVKVENGSLDRAIKIFKKKFEKTGVLKELRRRKNFEKKSVKRRNEILKASYIESLKKEEE